MHEYQRDFLTFAMSRGVLRFGDFTLKSGRKSPYFFNTGLFQTGGDLAQLGDAYARAIAHAAPDFDMLFGPAYKGIPLVAAIAVELARHFDRDLPYAFNRKEVKAHGEGGDTVGAPLEGRVLIVDDVISAGTSIRESIEIIRAAGAEPAGVAVALDRQERGEGKISAAQEIREREDIPVISIVTLDDLVAYLDERSDDLAHFQDALREYRARYGA